MKLIFAGTPAPAEPTLLALEREHEISAVVTRTDAFLGRKKIITPSPIAALAEKLDIQVIKTNTLDAAATEQIAEHAPDLGVIVAYGGLVRQPLLSVPRLGWINLHFSLLPRWRGAAPVQHALIAGDTVTGATVFQLVEELDAGDIFASFSQKIQPLQNAGALLDELAHAGANLVKEVVAQFVAGTAKANPQRGEVSYAPKLRSEDGRINWQQTAWQIMRRINGVTPEPGAFTLLSGNRFKILQAEPVDAVTELAPGHIKEFAGVPLIGTADNALRLIHVQPAGKKVMTGEEWWRGVTQRTSSAHSFEMFAQ